MKQNLELKRGKRMPGNIVKVQLTKNGQYSVTIPKGFAWAMGLKKGSIVAYELKQDGIKMIKWKK